MKIQIILPFFLPTMAHFITKKEANEFLLTKVRVRRGFFESFNPKKWVDPAIEWSRERNEDTWEAAEAAKKAAEFLQLS